MDVLQMRLKLVIDWIVSKKQDIYTLVVNKMPIYKTIKDFIQTYIRHMTDLTQIAEKCMQNISRNIEADANRTLLDLFDLIRQKQIVGIEEWTQKLSILSNKYEGVSKADTRPFPDIFKDIDANIQYYTQLRTKLQLAIKKSQQSRNTSPKLQRGVKEQASYRLSSQNQQRNTNKGKIDHYAQIYEKIYGTNFKENKKQQNSRSTGKIRTSPNFNSRRSNQLSAYELVNPKYSPRKYDTKYETYSSQRGQKESINYEKQSKYFSTKQQGFNSKYQQYKADLLSGLQRQQVKQPYIRPTTMANNQQNQHTSIRPKYTVARYLNYDSPVKNYYFNQGTDKDSLNGTKYTDLNSTAEKVRQTKYQRENNYLQDQTRTVKKQQPKKYQYLFDEDRNSPPKLNKLNNKDVTNQYTFGYKPIKSEQLKFNPSPKSIDTWNYRQDNKKQVIQYPFSKSNNDSLEQFKDYLGNQLNLDTPLFRDQDNLQQVLASSLLSSKRWDDGQQQQQFENSSHSQLDSLDEPIINSSIKQTGKFKQIKYTDEDSDSQQSPIDSLRLPIKKTMEFDYTQPLTIEKQRSTESKDLNMSFGRN